MSRKTSARLVLAALALSAGAATPADAAVTGTFPDTLEARTFATTNGGWTSAVDYNGLACIPGVTCPTASATYRTTGGAQGAADGHVRNTFGTLLGVLSTTTIHWTSPSFVSPAADGATLKFDVRPQIAALLAIGSVRIETTLVDVADGTKTAQLSSTPLTAASASFAQRQVDVPAGKLVAGRTYQLRISTSLTTNVSAVTSGSVDLDNVVFEAFTANSPSGLSGAFAPSGAARVTGSVDPTLGSADVKVEYGLTSAYGTTTAAQTVTGTGAQSYSIPLAGLTPGATYHYRVVATNTDGATTTSDATFVAPSAPAATAPLVAGAGNRRNRTVTFARGADTASAQVEVIGTDGTTVVDTVADGGDDGEVAITLPDADGAYGVRVVRTSPREVSSTSSVVGANLDRVAPSTTAVGLAVTPLVAQTPTRTVSFTRPGDAQTVTAQVIDAGGADVGAPVTVAGSSATVALGAADGAYRVKVTFTDAAGNGATVTSDPVSVDTTGPSTAALGLAVTPAVARGTSRTVSFTRPGDAQTVTAQVLDADDHAVGASVPVAGGSAGVTLGAADGAYRVKLTLTDALGNVSSATSPVARVDTAAPAAPDVTAPAAVTRSRAVSVPFAIEPGASAECRLDGGAWAACASPFVAGDLADGDHTLDLRQTDAAGNVGAVASVAWKVDTTAPAPAPQAAAPAPAPRAATPPAKPRATTTAAARVFTATVNDEQTSSSASAAPTVTVEQQAVEVGCRTAGVTLETCAVNLYATLRSDGRAVAAASRRILVGTGRTEADRSSRKLAVRVTLNATGRRLIASTPSGLQVAVAITGTPSEGKPITTMSRANLVARRMTVVVDGFGVNAAALPATARRELQTLARRLRGGATIRVIGHTDSSATDKAFLHELGLRRAEAVRRFLAAHGATATWTVGSRGDRAPRTPNATPAGRAANRRVVLRITL